MKIEILKDTENSLLDRREILIKVIHDASTPSFKDARAKIASAVSPSSKDVVVVHSIISRPGVKGSIAEANVYKDKARAFKVEMRHLLAKNFPEEVKPLEKEAGAKKEAPKKAPERKPEKAEKKAEGKKEG